jgi:hypothetical protein
MRSSSRSAPRVLALFAARAQAGRPYLGPEEISRHFGWTPGGGVNSVERLFRQRLILPMIPRQRPYKWKLAPEERLSRMRFRLGPRGAARLRWWAQQDSRIGVALWR